MQKKYSLCKEAAAHCSARMRVVLTLISLILILSCLSLMIFPASRAWAETDSQEAETGEAPQDQQVLPDNPEPEAVSVEAEVADWITEDENGTVVAPEGPIDVSSVSFSAVGLIQNTDGVTQLSPTITANYQGYELVEGIDFTVNLVGAIPEGGGVAPSLPEAGSYYVDITGIGSFTNSTRLSEVFTLYEAPISGTNSNPITSGSNYRIVSDADANLLLDVAGKVPVCGSNVSVWTSNSGANQSFSLVYSDGYYTLASTSDSNLVLDASGSQPTIGANVSVWYANGGLNQKWVFVPADKEDPTAGYLIRSASSVQGTSFVLDAAGKVPATGSNISIWQANGGTNQVWHLFDSCDLSRFANISCTGMVKNIEQGTTEGLEPTISIEINGMVLSRSEGDYSVSYVEEETELPISGEVPTESGSYLVTITGNEAKGIYGTIDISEPFCLYDVSFEINDYQDFSVRSAANSALVLDAAGKTPACGANISVWYGNGGVNQVFQFELGADGYYTIKLSGWSDYVLDASGSQPAVGANVSVWYANGGLNQKWVLVPSDYDTAFMVVSAANNNLVLDAAGQNPSSGSNVSLWTKRGSSNQIFTVERVASSDGLFNMEKFSTTVKGKSSIESKIAASFAYGTPCISLPSYADSTKVSLDFETMQGEDTILLGMSPDSMLPFSSGETVDLSDDGVEKTSSGSSVFYVSSVDGLMQTKLFVMQSANVGALYISSKMGREYVDNSASHSTSDSGTISCLKANGNVIYDGDLKTIKGRGNSTWHLEKKPYNITLSSKADLSQSKEKAKKWVLLANANDKTELRNYLTYQLGLNFGLGDTPSCAFYDLYYDGEYRGLYLVCEKVEVNDNRVEITDLEDLNDEANDGADLDGYNTARGTNAFGYTYQYVSGMKTPTEDSGGYSGGYLIEMDPINGYKERSWFDSSYGTIAIKSPENASEKEVRYISERFQEAIIIGATPTADISSVFDVDALARQFIIQAFAKNPDATWGSTFFYKEAHSSQFIAGPLWDFDASYCNHRWANRGEVNYDPEGWGTVRYYPCFNNIQFRKAVFKIWNEEFLPLVTTYISGEDSLLRQYESFTSSAAAMDQALWNGLIPSSFTINQNLSREDQIDNLETWTNARVQWMTLAMADWG